MTEILNYISAWVTLLAAMLGLCVFLVDLASKKNLFPRAGDLEKSWLTGTANKKELVLSARNIKKILSLFHVGQINGFKRDYLFSLAGNW